MTYVQDTLKRKLCILMLQGRTYFDALFDRKGESKAYHYLCIYLKIEDHYALKVFQTRPNDRVLIANL